MSKLTMSLDPLAVETFDVGARHGEGAGTVRANPVAPTLDCTANHDHPCNEPTNGALDSFCRFSMGGEVQPNRTNVCPTGPPVRDTVNGTCASVTG